MYGGYEGSDREVSQNADSLGEALFNKLRASGKKIVLVKQSILKRFWIYISQISIDVI